MNKDAEKWLRRKESIIAMYNNHCAYCGCEITIDRFQIDHVVSKSEYERNRRKYQDLDFHGIVNLKPTCCSCNNYKRDWSIEGFRSQIEKQISRFRRDHPTFRLAERYGQIHCTPVNVVFYFEALENGKKI